MGAYNYGRVLDLMLVFLLIHKIVIIIDHFVFTPFQMRSSIQHYGAHEQGSETSCLCFAHDNQTLISRGGKERKDQLAQQRISSTTVIFL